MCVIVLCKTEKPSVRDLHLMAEDNPSGSGVAWVDGRRIRWQKGLDTEAVIRAALDAPLPIGIHFRLAWKGASVEAGAAHPFPLSERVETALEGDADGVLFHNGYWSDWKSHVVQASLIARRSIPAGPWSDSRAIAWLVTLTGPGFLDLLTDQRTLYFTPDIQQTRGVWYDQGGWQCTSLTWAVTGGTAMIPFP